MLNRRDCVLLALCVVSMAAAGSAQSSDNKPYTLHTGTQVVLTDVTVLDNKGNPVRGLKPSDFEIFDDGNRQKLRSFEAHDDHSVPILNEASQKPGLYTNAALLHPPPVINVWLLDTTTITLMDQMYLTHQLTQAVDALPADEPVALYWRYGQIVNLLENFTSDHERLKAAIHKVMPRMTNQDAQLTTDIDATEQMIAALSPLPGRKNLIWFSGGSPLAIKRGKDWVGPGVDLRPMLDGLEVNRIAVYPVDARGLSWANSGDQSDQHAMMQDTAESTGGQAFYNNSGFVEGVGHFMATDGSFYTLTYTPPGLHDTGKWHAVEVKVKGGYQLSYRRGYYDENKNHSVSSPKRPILADGKPAQAPNTQLEPIIFRARVIAATDLPEEPAASASVGATPATPAPPATTGRKTNYAIRYFLPAADFQQSVQDGKGQVMAGAAILAVNDYGRPVGHAIQVYKLNFDPKQLEAEPNGLLSLDQEIAVPKGQNYLYLAVWDTATGRVGTIQLPLEVPRTQQAQR